MNLKPPLPDQNAKKPIDFLHSNYSPDLSRHPSIKKPQENDSNPETDCPFLTKKIRKPQKEARVPRHPRMFRDYN